MKHGWQLPVVKHETAVKSVKNRKTNNALVRTDGDALWECANSGTHRKWHAKASVWVLWQNLQFCVYGTRKKIRSPEIRLPKRGCHLRSKRCYRSTTPFILLCTRMLRPLPPMARQPPVGQGLLIVETLRLRSGHTERGLPQRTAVSVRCGMLHSKQTLLTIIFWKHSS